MAQILDVQNRIVVAEALPGPQPDNGMSAQPAFARGNKYGEAVVQNMLAAKHGLAAEGSYFVTPGSTTPGTKLLLGAATVAFSDTTGILYLFNPQPAGGIKAYLDYIKLVGLLAHTTSTDALYFAMVMDTIRTPTTDNTAVLVPVSPNSDVSPAAKLTVKAQSSATSSVLPASNTGTKRVVATGSFPRWVGVLGDEATIVCGSWDGAGSVQGLTAATAAAPGKFFAHTGPIIIGPQRSLVLMLWQPANTVAPQAMFEMGHFER